MKILFVTPYFYPSVGGVQNYVLNIGTRLRREHGHEVVVVTGDSSIRAVKRDCSGDILTYRLPVTMTISNTPCSFKWRRQMIAIMSMEQPDVINAHTPVPIISDIAARIAWPVPFILTYHNDLVKDTIIGNIAVKTLSRLVVAGTLQSSDVIIATSRYYAEQSPYLRKYLSRVAIVPPGVDVERFNGSVSKEWLKEAYPGRKIVFFLGLMDRAHGHKGVNVLIRALPQIRRSIPNVLVIAGGRGNAVPEYAALARSLDVGTHIVFPGFISEDMLPRYYAGADVFVLPSTSPAEGFGMVVLEASACGTPVIGSNVGGISQAIDDGADGILVRPRNVDDLSDAIVNVLSSPGFAARLGARGQSKVMASWAWACQSQKTHNVLAALLS